MSSNKKQVRANFRQAVFSRDGNRCRCCGKSGCELDAHHITDRTLMPNGGYVPENGITLCGTCHELAEKYHSTGVAERLFSPSDLYDLIGSSYEAAVRAAERLK